MSRSGSSSRCSRRRCLAVSRCNTLGSKLGCTTTSTAGGSVLRCTLGLRASGGTTQLAISGCRPLLWLLRGLMLLLLRWRLLRGLLLGEVVVLSHLLLLLLLGVATTASASICSILCSLRHGGILSIRCMHASKSGHTYDILNSFQ